jgi:hypothetical protein
MSDAGLDFTLKEIATFARVSVRTVRRAIARGELACIQWNARVIRVSYADFIDWRAACLGSNESAPIAAPARRSRCAIDPALDYELEHVASFAGVGVDTIRALADAGRLPVVRYGVRGALRVPGLAFLRLRESCRVPANRGNLAATTVSSPQLSLSILPGAA